MLNPGAEAHLCADPVMRGVVGRVGPYAIKLRSRYSPYQSLVRAVTYQQLNGRAAATIFGRFLALFDGAAFPSPDAVLAAHPRTLRRAGLARAKTLAIKDIARHAAAGAVPTRRAAAQLTDEQMIEQLTKIRGVGRWTVEMLLIFTLGRPDVLPVDDFGVREGYRIAYGLSKQPTPKDLAAFGERWKPYRSVAAWYLWQVANEARAQTAITRAKVTTK